MRPLCFNSRFVSLGLLLLSAWASAQQTYTLKPRAATGEQWSFDVTTALKQKGQINSNGQLFRPIDQSANQHRKGVLAVLSAEDGKPSAIRVAFDAGSSSSGNMGGQPVPQFVLAGKTVTLRRGEGGAVTNDLAEQPDEQTLQELNRMLEVDTSFYPARAVALNDEWQADPAVVAKQFQLGPDDKVSLKCKLLAIKDVDGRQVADVSLAGQVVKHDQGFIETTTTLEGMSRVDLVTGQTLAADLTGKMSTKGSKQVPGPDGQPINVDVNADGEIESHQAVKLISGPAAVAPHDAPPPMRDNPLAPRPSTLAGTYKGDDLSIELTGEPSHYSGALTMQDKKFPVSARSEGYKLTGTFESDGNQFEFAATLDAQTLTLTSGGNTYTLKKGAVNPLAQPKRKNPLAP